MTTFVHSFCSRHVLCIDAKDYETIGDLKAYLSETKGFPLTACFFVCDGNIVEDDEPVLQGFVYHTFPRILGGKGGFGSMLRAIGAQIEKTTNREALRDLSGRRMRDVNNEKALKEWISKQADKEKERDEKRQERIVRRRAMPNHKFDDPEYDKQKSRLAENQEDALQEGLKKAPGTSASATMTYEESLVGKSAVKRKCEMAGPSSSKVRKATEWLGIDIDDMDIDSDDTSGGEDSQSGEDGAIDIPGAAGNCDDVSTDSSDNCATTRMEPSAADGVTMVDSTISSVADSDTLNICNSSLTNTDHELCIEKASSNDNLGTSHDSNVPSIHEEKCEVVASNTDDLSDNKVNIQDKIQTLVDTQDSSTSIIKTEDVSVNSEDSVPVKEDCIKKESAITETAETEKGNGNQESVSSETEQTNIKQEPFNLDSVGSITELLPLGLEGLKSELMCRGLKCGGTLEQRAERLFSVKGINPEEIDVSLFAKPSRGKQKKKKN